MVEDHVDEVGEDGEQGDQVHRLEEELEAARGAHEADHVLDGEVHRGEVVDVQDGQGRGVVGGRLVGGAVLGGLVHDVLVLRVGARKCAFRGLRIGQ